MVRRGGMNGRTKVGVGAAALVLGAGIAFAQGKPDYAKVKIKATKVAPHITELEGMGGNMTVLDGADGKLLVDTEFAPLAPKIEAALKKIDAKSKLKWVVDTHYHGDHTGGNPVFGKQAPIIAQENVRTRLAEGTTLFGQTTPPMKAPALPSVTFDKEMALHLDGENVKLTFYPHGHTDGDSMVWFTDSKVLATGDDFTNGQFPFVDVEHGGDVEHDIANLDDVLSKIDDTWTVIPGHGAIAKKKDVAAFRAMLQTSVATVKDKLAKGETVEQIQAEGLPEEYKTYAAGFIDTKTWLGIVAASVQHPTGVTR